MVNNRVNFATEILPETLLRAIALVTDSIDIADQQDRVNPQKKVFFDSIVRFQKSLTRGGKPTVSRQAVRLWEAGAIPSRRPAMDFLRNYLIWRRTSKEGQSWDQPRQEAFGLIEQYLSDARSEAEENPTDSNIDGRLPPLDPHIGMSMQLMLKISNRSEHTEASAFFRGGRSDEYDQSYYLMYRYSTNNGAILKSFLVIQKPVRDLRNIHVFNHFVWGGQLSPFMTHVFRECEGFILKLARSFYFVGYNYTVPVDKRREPESYRRERITAKWSPNGMGVLAFEYDDVHRAPGLFPGLTMTLAGMGQPVVARVAMLHIGTRQLLGRTLSDQNVSPTELPAKDVGGDLAATVGALRELGCRRLGIVLEEYLHRSSSASDLGEQVGAQILRMVDNRPAWQEPDPEETHGTCPAAGAIETFGIGRPRD